MKIFITVFLVLILAVSLMLGLDENAMKIHDEAFERAMIAFGLAKGLNAIISLIQGTELSFAPVGIGLNFSVGEVLDPFNDMVERFSWVMLFASVSLGIQKLLLVLSAKIFLQAALALSIGASIVLLWMKKVQNYSFFLFSMRILLLFLILRFGAILFVYSSEYFYNSVLETEFVSSSIVIEKTKERLQEMEAQNKQMVESKKESGLFGSMSSKYNELVKSLNISKQLESLQDSIEAASRKIISLITIFIVQSLIMPLLFLWLLITSIRLVLSVKLDNDKIALRLNNTLGGVEE
ncbi:hypothetical protein KJ877_02310 [bacterium]|nr:hypothetical protein [bacterium]MBU1990678.1 hypothetical protein [bacterium]